MFVCICLRSSSFIALLFCILFSFQFFSFCFFLTTFYRYRSFYLVLLILLLLFLSCIALVRFYLAQFVFFLLSGIDFSSPDEPKNCVILLILYFPCVNFFFLFVFVFHFVFKSFHFYDIFCCCRCCSPHFVWPVST